MQKQLYDVGVDMQFEVVPIEEYTQRIRAGQFDAVLMDSISGPTVGRPFIFWRSAREFKGLNMFGVRKSRSRTPVSNTSYVNQRSGSSFCC